MKYRFLIALILVSISCKSQEQKTFSYEGFELQILNYQPKKNKNVSENSFQDALFFLDEIQNSITRNKKANVSDYWNILTVFNNLNESNNNIDIAFKKFTSEENSCEYILSLEEFFDKYNEYTRIKLNQQFKKCKKNSQTESGESIDTRQYSEANGFDKNLVQIINQIKIDDQKTRDNENLQNKLDAKNQKKIDSLYAIHQTYIGKTLVGNKFKHVMWAVIQHANVTYMEKYLTTVISAVKNGELNQEPLKYLIDRIYSNKYNYQIFGTQVNIKMADNKIRKKVKTKYNIE